MSFVTIKVRRGTTTQWNSTTKNLANGEIGFNTTLNKFKIGTGSAPWTDLQYLNTLPSEFNELVQDAVDSALVAGTGISKNYNDAANTLTISVDSTIANKAYVDAAVAALGSTAADTYIPDSLYGNPDGVATLDADGYVPQSQLTNTLTSIASYVDGAVAGVVNSAPATLNTLKELSDALGADANFATTTATALGTKITATSQDTLRNKTISISNGITSVSGYDNIEGFFGQSNIPILQDGLDKGGKINISSLGVITVATSGLGYTSGIAIIGGGTRILIEIGGNTLTGTKAQFNAAMTDADFVTIAGTETLTNKTLTSPVINSPTGITKSNVGLENVDNTSDNTKALITYIPVSTATRTISSATDKNTLIECSAACTITIPNDTQDSGWPVGSMVEVRQIGTGQVTITKDAAVTIQGTDSQFKSRVQWSTIMLEKRAANSWLITGDTTA
jgi:Major tropism determinant N-terminal domain